eukprot:PhF_6_TR4718/c0_g1_i1/m.6531
MALAAWKSDVVVYNQQGNLTVVGASDEGMVVSSKPLEPWIPCGHQQIGLVEAYDRRGGSAAATYIPLCSRPQEELERNFTDYQNKHVNLNQDVYLLSRTRQTLNTLDRIDEGRSYAITDVVADMQMALPSMTEFQYFLVAYRDYSRYAVRHHSSEQRRDGWLKPPYIRRCFAIRVGTSAGVFIPITDAQFLHGCELLSSEITRGRKKSPYLNKEEFVQLSVVGTDGRDVHLRSSAVASAFGTEHGFAGHAVYNATNSLTNAWLRWTAVRDRHYVSVGRALVKGCLLALSGAVLYAQLVLPARNAGRLTASAYRKVAGSNSGSSSSPSIASSVTVSAVQQNVLGAIKRFW